MTQASPQSLEAERALLGGLLLDSECWDLVDSKVEAADFYSATHAKVYTVIAEHLHAGKPIDMLVLHDYVIAKGVAEDFGGLSYIAALPEHCPSTENLGRYADLVLEKAVARRTLESVAELQKRIYAGEDAPEVIAQAQAELEAQAGRGGGGTWSSLPDLMQDNREQLEHRYDHRGQVHGLATGFPDLDRILGGMQPSDLLILAARPAMGKTAMALKIASNAAKAAAVGVFSLEMGGPQLSMRVLGSEARVDPGKLRSGMLSKAEDWPRLDYAQEDLARSRMYIDDTPSLDIAQIRARARALQAQHPDLALIVVDYLQLASAKGTKSREQEISAVSRGLKHLAKSLNVPVLALSQLNRAVEQRANKRPMVSDLRESGAIEQDADVIAFIYRDEYYNPETTTEPNVAEVIIAKQRNGPTGTARLYFHQGRFGNLEQTHRGAGRYGEHRASP